MLVLWRRIVKELCRENQGGEKDAMDGASESFGNWWKFLLQSVEVDEAGHQRRYLHVGFADQGCDEAF